MARIDHTTPAEQKTNPAQEALKKDFNLALSETIKSINSAPRARNKGVWSIEDYIELCREEKSDFFQPIQTGFANPEYWEKTGKFSFKLKSGKKPSEAIKAFIDGFTVADSGNILLVAQYAALLKTFGEDKFNALFTKELPSLAISTTPYDKTFENGISFFYGIPNGVGQGTIGARPVIAGDLCVISGVSKHYIGGALTGDYSLKHPAGTAHGICVMCVGKNEANEDLFVGFGPGKFNSPLTENEIKQLLLDAFNKDSNHLDKQMMRETNRFVPTHDMFMSTDSVKGFLPGSVVRPDFAKLDKFLKIKPEMINPEFCYEVGKSLLPPELLRIMERPCGLHFLSSTRRLRSIFDVLPTPTVGHALDEYKVATTPLRKSSQDTILSATLSQHVPKSLEAIKKELPANSKESPDRTPDLELEQPASATSPMRLRR